MRQDNTQVQANDPQSLTANLTTRALLVNLTITAWSARRTDREAGNAVAAKFGSDAGMGQYRKYLIDPAAIDPIINFATSCRDEFRRRSAPWGDNGDRIMRADGYNAFLTEFHARRDRWEELTADLYARYPQLVNEAALKLNGLWHMSEYPTMANLMTRFAFGWDISGVNPDFRVELGDEEVARIRRDIEARIQALTEQAMQDTASKIREVVGHMSERLHAYKPSANDARAAGAFRDTLVENIRELVAVIPSLNITGSPEIDAIAARMAADLCAHDASTLRDSEAVRVQVADAADEILASLKGFIA